MRMKFYKMDCVHLDRDTGHQCNNRKMNAKAEKQLINLVSFFLSQEGNWLL